MFRTTVALHLSLALRVTEVMSQALQEHTGSPTCAPLAEQWKRCLDARSVDRGTKCCYVLEGQWSSNSAKKVSA